jgi:hypothetical protein
MSTSSRNVFFITNSLLVFLAARACPACPAVWRERRRGQTKTSQEN